MVSAGKLRKLWDFLSDLRSSVCERRLERTVLRPAILPVKIAQFTKFFRQVGRHTVNWLSLTDSDIGSYRETHQFEISARDAISYDIVVFSLSFLGRLSYVTVNTAHFLLSLSLPIHHSLVVPPI